MDAFAAGRTVIYGGNTGLDDVVADAGIRVWPLTVENLAAEMGKALRDDAVIATYEHRGIDRVRTHFSVEKVTRQRVTFYQGVIANLRQACAGGGL